MLLKQSNLIRRTLRRTLAIFGAALVFSPVLVASCGSKSGLREGFRDAGFGATDAGPDAIGPECVKDEDCASDDLCQISRCQEGHCTAPIAMVCNDNDECTEDTCQPENGKCNFRQLALDQDGDGYKGPRPGYAAGAPGSCGDDCDDTSAKAHPGGIEVCDGVDNNCNLVIDEGMTYVPAGGGDIRVSETDQLQAGRGGIAWNQAYYSIGYSGQKNSDWHAYVKGLNPDGSTKFGSSPFTNVPNDSYAGPIVWTGKIFGTAWSDRRDGNFEIYFNRLNDQGEKLGPDLRISNTPGFSLHPTMIWNGAEFVLAWDEDSDSIGTYRVWGQRLSIEGQVLGEVQPLTGSVIDAESPQIAKGEKTLAIAFTSVDSISKKVDVRLFQPDFGSPGDPITLSADDAVDPSIVWNKDRYVIVYSKRIEKAPGSQIWASVVNETGQILIKDQPITNGANFARTQTLLALGDRLLLVWADDHDGAYELYSEMLNSDLTMMAPRQRITNDPNNSIDPLMVFGPEGDVGVLFDDDRDKGYMQVFFTRLTCVAGQTP